MSTTPINTVVVIMKHGMINQVLSTTETEILYLEEVTTQDPSEYTALEIAGDTYHIAMNDLADKDFSTILQIKNLMRDQYVDALSASDLEQFNKHFHVKAHAMGLAYLVMTEDGLSYENEEMYGEDQYLVFQSKVPGQRDSFKIKLQYRMEASEEAVRNFAFLAKCFGYDASSIKTYLKENIFEPQRFESTIRLED